MSRTITITVGSETIQCDLSELEITDPDAERHQVAAMVAWWGSVSASAESYAEKCSARAAQWYNAALSRCIGEDGKIPEWKAKAYVGGQEEYLALCEIAADAKAAHSRANSIHWSFVRKMGMLQAMLSGEKATQGTSNEIGRVPDQRPPDQTDNRFARFREARRGSTP